jgi:hypothetical protein
MSAMSNHRLIALIGLILIMTATARCAAHGVATMLASADKICNAMILIYLDAGLLIHLLHKINAAISKILQPSKQQQLTWNAELPQALTKLPMQQHSISAPPHFITVIGS